MSWISDYLTGNVKTHKGESRFAKAATYAGNFGMHLINPVAEGQWLYRDAIHPAYKWLSSSNDDPGGQGPAGPAATNTGSVPTPSPLPKTPMEQRADLVNEAVNAQDQATRNLYAQQLADLDNKFHANQGQIDTSFGTAASQLQGLSTQSAGMGSAQGAAVAGDSTNAANAVAANNANATQGIAGASAGLGFGGNTPISGAAADAVGALKQTASNDSSYANKLANLNASDLAFLGGMQSSEASGAHADLQSAYTTAQNQIYNNQAKATAANLSDKYQMQIAQFDAQQQQAASTPYATQAKALSTLPTKADPNKTVKTSQGKVTQPQYAANFISGLQAAMADKDNPQKSVNDFFNSSATDFKSPKDAAAFWASIGLPTNPQEVASLR